MLIDICVMLIDVSTLFPYLHGGALFKLVVMSFLQLDAIAL